MARFIKRSKTAQEIPMGPMADISFLLIIFFMVTTVFVVYRGFHVDLPLAEQLNSLKSRRNVVSIWIGPQGKMMVDEYDAELSTIAGIISEKLQENPRIIVQLKADRNTQYKMISGVIGELKKANALRVSFIAKQEK